MPFLSMYYRIISRALQSAAEWRTFLQEVNHNEYRDEPKVDFPQHSFGFCRVELVVGVLLVYLVVVVKV
jgi:hypothetical protein